MNHYATSLLWIMLLGASGIVFGWNVQHALRTGGIWAKSIYIDRVRQPAAFWITVAVCAVATLFCFGGVATIVCALISALM